jgi:hypothetical protein
MSDSVLRKKLIRLAYMQPELRSDLLPLIRQAAESKSFDEAVEGKKFHHPETGNQVAFGSLPPKEQSKIRAEWSEKNKGDGDKKKPQKTSEKLYALERRLQDIAEADTISIIENVSPTKWDDLSKEKREVILDSKVRPADVSKVDKLYRDYAKVTKDLFNDWDPEQMEGVKRLPPRDSIKTYKDLHKVRDVVQSSHRQVNDQRGWAEEDDD